ncbi:MULTISPECIES: hypothetical protein [Dellaglioa]|uniref:DUF1659 domain-containing protein n=3 Tax=Dellaglioa TaxID=2767880 RepID=A0A0R1HG67_9LACO|nr:MULTISPECIES: hypothetical protein [Dellaglioa]KRK45501.1 hypothetical protein FC66_GL001316 [Dellaglioa algida DSM 15638]MCZ2491602.1 hypothetical protein [Dellaglioa carnosa]MCZ2492148.1 hypothetical protein [Dellaglioa carnosa]MCZ2494679.1 hypothetical protein [Dellaglioa carnosa]MDK1718424.1 hypothetical protein [Dellaglioa algida]
MSKTWVKTNVIVEGLSTDGVERKRSFANITENASNEAIAQLGATVASLTGDNTVKMTIRTESSILA